MYSIGKFSKLTGVSTKTLIWYDNIGLLKPDFVNEENGYRYYTADSIKKLADIQYFQSLDFTINEIMNLSENVISNKIKFLLNKINYIEANIPFLENLKEGTMKEKILTIYDIEKSKEHQARLQGRWVYALSTNNFAHAIMPCPMKTKPKDMPRELFFGEKQSGTDTEKFFYYGIDQINLNKKTYNFLIINLDDNLILFERQNPYAEEAQNEELVFHVYQRLSNTPYTKVNLEQIILKSEYRKIKNDIKFIKYDGRFEGIWQHIDNINESDINKYKEGKNKNAFNILYPMYSKLSFNDKEVAVMPDEESLTVGKKTYTRSNSMMKLCTCSNDTYIENTILNVKQKIIEKDIDGQKYLFINMTNDLDIDEKTIVYVYKKN